MLPRGSGMHRYRVMASCQVGHATPGGSPMSLRFRLIGLVCVVLLISLALAGMTAYSNAPRSVLTEMGAAFLVGRQAIERASDGVRTAGDPPRHLAELVPYLRGARHLRERDAGLR